MLCLLPFVPKIRGLTAVCSFGQGDESQLTIGSRKEAFRKDETDAGSRTRLPSSHARKQSQEPVQRTTTDLCVPA